MKRFILTILTLVVIVLALFYFNVFWKSPSFYRIENPNTLTVPVVDMNTYMTEMISNHRRPYIYSVSANTGGKVVVLGVEHTSDPSKTQFDSIRQYWKEHQPTVALVEGRMGFLIRWTQNPIERYGESGLLSDLAKKGGVDLYTWEPHRDDEVELLIQKHSAEKLAMFYSLRPYFGISKANKPENPEEKLQGYIDSRTDYNHIKGAVETWEDIDKIWQKDFPDLDWRTYSSGYGWPGYLHDIWNSSNLARDEHMINIIIEEVKKGETVIVTMGSSHAPRIENTLKAALKAL